MQTRRFHPASNTSQIANTNTGIIVIKYDETAPLIVEKFAVLYGSADYAAAEISVGETVTEADFPIRRLLPAGMQVAGVGFQKANNPGYQDWYGGEGFKLTSRELQVKITNNTGVTIPIGGILIVFGGFMQ